MKKDQKNRLICSMGINIVLIILTLTGFFICLQEKDGFTFFRFYTEDSNLLSMAACIVYVIIGIIQIIKGTYEIPKWVQVFKYITSCCLMVTFTVVIFILAPSIHFNYQKMMLEGSMLFYHFLCPVITILAFLFVDFGEKLNKNCKFYALVPTIIYAIVMVALNILKVTKGPYMFLRVYDQPVYMSVIWFVIVIGIAYLLAWGTLKLKMKIYANSLGKC